MSKKLITIVLTLVVALLGVTLVACNNGGGTGETTTGTGETTTAPATNGTLTVGFDAGMPPMGFLDGSDYIGFDLDCAAAVAAKLGKELVLKPIIWDEKDNELGSGNIDCIWNGFTMTEERLEKYEWTKAYMVNEQVVLVLADSGYERLADLAGKTAGAQLGSTAVGAVDDNPEFKDSLKGDLVLKSDNVSLVQDLKAGVIDCLVTDRTLAEYMIAKQGEKLKMLDETLADEEYGIGFLKGNTALRDTVQNALYELYADGTLVRISNEWFGTDVFINMTAGNAGEPTTAGETTTVAA